MAILFGANIWAYSLAGSLAWINMFAAGIIFGLVLAKIINDKNNDR